jgi:hypothetical protein
MSLVGHRVLSIRQYRLIKRKRESRGNMEKTLKADEVEQFLRSLNGKFFTIEFVKRTTGEVRKMTATTNYQSKLAGGEATYDFTEKKLIPVWDLAKQAFRSIPLDAVLTINAKGDTYKIEKAGE